MIWAEWMACNEVLETDAARRRLRALRLDVITVAQLRMLRQGRDYPDGLLGPSLRSFVDGGRSDAAAICLDASTKSAGSYGVGSFLFGQCLGYMTVNIHPYVSRDNFH